MRFEKTGKWSIGDDDCFYGEFSTKEEALKEAKTLELDSIGQVYSIHYTEGDFIFKFNEMFDSVLEDVLYEIDTDRVAFDKIISDQEQIDLAVLFATTTVNYLNEHDLLRNCFLVKDIEQIIDYS